ncbi:hypothetical protein COCC4DRAFT_58611 [Bipolaris maydis ATCC 48331]|uniref:Uncharacterized protein n=2 Tax=Cochliobolus heterostrophus TaxID=5016 RepID=M2T8V8_COCH5|nr:uncharacterized protein COCC4DRAFT_58611 [Bipolaris maydis ATCC 48331]EMD93985.1 hypothetical protein COCHEDRAFT_1094165 [Bipolaris maydis C5]ENI07713.1 hypothetical protein COCC4DRAFT_58611 [Bipolaris maydis ATCC 48331]KAJ6209441.1 hypothetical protein PSV09DRAFT_1094165 [Bipolaris maydis]
MCFVQGGSRVPAQQLVVTLDGRVAIDTLHGVGRRASRESQGLIREKSTSGTGRAEALGGASGESLGRKQCEGQQTQLTALGQVAAEPALRHGDADKTRAEPMRGGRRLYTERAKDTTGARRRVGRRGDSRHCGGGTGSTGSTRREEGTCANHGRPSRAQPGGRLRPRGAAVMATAHHIPSCPPSLPPQASERADGQGDAQNAAGG